MKEILIPAVAILAIFGLPILGLLADIVSTSLVCFWKILVREKRVA